MGKAKRKSAIVGPAEIQGDANVFLELNTAVADHQAGLAKQMGLTLTEFKCLGHLHGYGEMAPRELAEIMGLTRAAITGIVGRLEKLKFVACSTDSEDRRSLRIRPTKKHLETLAELYAPLAESATQLHQQYTPQEVDMVLDYLRLSSELVRAATERMRQPSARKR